MLVSEQFGRRKYQGVNVNEKLFKKKRYKVNVGKKLPYNEETTEVLAEGKNDV